MARNSIFMPALALALASGSWAASDKRPRPQPTPPAPLPTVIVQVAPGSDVSLLALAHGARFERRLRSDPSFGLWSAGTVERASALAERLQSDPRVAFAWQNRAIRRVRHWTPNDPYFPKDQPAGFPGQWHLQNGYVTGRDARVAGAWAKGWTGQGVRIGIVDDGFEITHPDLAANYVSGDSFDFGEGEPNPSPASPNDNHGTAVAGVAAARGANNAGVTGVAPLVQFAGLRVDFDAAAEEQFIDAILWKSSGANPTLFIKNHSYGIGDPYVLAAGTVQVLESTARNGVVHVRSAGNERATSGEDANKKQENATPDAIVVAALGSDGTWADYSNFGANVFVTAPSNSNKGTAFRGVITTDRSGAVGYNTGTGDVPLTAYTFQFGGTSSSAPVVTGALALARQANPLLDVRLAKHLLARTSDVVDAADSTAESDGGWVTNAGGLKFNQNYGFGLVDADGLTQMAQQTYSVTPLVVEGSGTQTVNQAIPENESGIARTFVARNALPVEDVLVHLSITHAYRGDLEATLTSPRGRTQRLFIRDPGDQGTSLAWRFLANGFWGELGNGTWTLRVRDTAAQDTGTWGSYAITVRYGGPTSRLGSNLAFFRTSDRRIGMWPLADMRIAGWVSLPTPGAGWQPVAFADLNGDRRTDMILVDSAGKVGAWLLRGSTVIGWRSVTTLGAGWRIVGTGDIDGDGDADLGLHNATTGRLGMWLMQNGSVVGWRTIGDTAAGTLPKGFADFNGDGRVDVLLDITGSRRFGVWTLNNGAITGWRSIGSYAAGWQLVGIGDPNVDGKPDVLVHQVSTRALGSYLLNLTTVSGWRSLGTGPAGWQSLGFVPF